MILDNQRISFAYISLRQALMTRHVDVIIFKTITVIPWLH